MKQKLLLSILSFLIVFQLFAQERGKIEIPNLNGYVTLKCDFHIHTVFSDGLVWPTVRVTEAYREGLDAIAITEHLEYRPHKEDVTGSHNRSYEIAKKAADSKGIILIKANEITRKMPPGHHNALFITDSEELIKTDYIDVFKAAKAQGAFLFWNHPNWKYQQPDTTLWWEEHTQLYEQGFMHGIEVVNGDYCKESHRWCLEKNLTMLGNSDVHNPIQADVDFAAGKHRTMTLVFAKEASEKGIREALFERRTAIYHDELIIGEEKYLKELFENALELTSERRGNYVQITVKNNSDLVFHLNPQENPNLNYHFQKIHIQPHQDEQHFLISIQDNAKVDSISFIVKNFLVQPNTGMKYSIKL